MQRFGTSLIPDYVVLQFNDDEASDDVQIGFESEAPSSKGGPNKEHTHESEKNYDQTSRHIHDEHRPNVQADQGSGSNGGVQNSQSNIKWKEKVVEDENAGDDINFSDLESLLDSDYELEEDCDLENLIVDKDTEWERITAMFRNHNSTEPRAETEAEYEDEEVEFSYLENHESSSEGGDETAPCRLNAARFNPETDMHDPKFKLRMIFSNRQEFKLACKQHGVKEGRRIRFKKNDKRRVTAICVDCDWMVSTTHLDRDGSLHVVSVNTNHSCGTTFNHGCANSAFLCHKYKEDIRIMPHIKISEFVQKVYSDLKLNISRTKASLTKKRAIIEIEGDYTMQYRKLPDYCYELKRTNPGTNVVLKTIENDDGDEVFTVAAFPQ